MFFIGNCVVYAMPPRYHRLQLLKASQHLQPDFEAKKRTYLCWSKKVSPSDNKMESPNKKKLLQVHRHVEFPHNTSSVRGPAPIQLFLLVARVKHFQTTRSSVQAWTERWTLRFPFSSNQILYIYILYICTFTNKHSLLHKLNMDTKSLWFWKMLFLWKQFRWSTTSILIFCFQECIIEQRTLGSGRNATGARSSSARISWRGWHPRRPGLKY